MKSDKTTIFRFCVPLPVWHAFLVRLNGRIRHMSIPPVMLAYLRDRPVMQEGYERVLRERWLGYPLTRAQATIPAWMVNLWRAKFPQMPASNIAMGAAMLSACLESWKVEVRPDGRPMARETIQLMFDAYRAYEAQRQAPKPSTPATTKRA